MNLLDKARNIFIFIIILSTFIFGGLFIQDGYKQFREISDRLDNIEGNIELLNNEIIVLKETASETDAKIDKYNNTLIDKIDTEIDNYIADMNEIAEIEELEEDIVTQNNTYVNTTYTESQTTYTQPTGDGVLTASKGVNYYGNQKETYYNLNMDGVISIAQSQGIEGEYWVRDDGCKMYGDYIIVAANLDTHPRGSLVETSLGTGIVLDTGSFAESNPHHIDIATDW